MIEYQLTKEKDKLVFLEDLQNFIFYLEKNCPHILLRLLKSYHSNDPEDIGLYQVDLAMEGFYLEKCRNCLKE